MEKIFELHIGRLLKKISEHEMTLISKQQLNSFLLVLAKKIFQNCETMLIGCNKKTITENEVLDSFLVIVPEKTFLEVKEYCQEALKNLEKVNTASRDSRQKKAGIDFPPSISEKILRNFGYSTLMVSKNAPLFLSAGLEKICIKILNEAVERAKDRNKLRITIRELELGVRLSTELNFIFEKLKFNFLGGGVIQKIYSELLKKPRKRKVEFISSNIETQLKKYRFKPGTVAVREIKKNQKNSDKLIFPKEPFERLIRRLIEGLNPDIKLSKKIFDILQYYIEQKIVKFLETTNKVTIHGNRIKVIKGDLILTKDLFSFL